MTYEDAAEAEFMKSIYVGRSGQLENTTFAILSPDGKKKLTKAGRGPFHEYRGSRDMAAGMKKIASSHQGADEASLTDTQLPLIKNLDLGLNVAAADGLPLIITVADSQEKLDGLARKLLPTAWSESFAGQFVYASVLDKKELKPITGAAKDPAGILIVEPGQFGLSGNVIARFDTGTSSKDVNSKLKDVITHYPRKQEGHDAHVQLGIKLGIDWKSQIPETDQQSLRAKARRRGN